MARVARVGWELVLGVSLFVVPLTVAAQQNAPTQGAPQAGDGMNWPREIGASGQTFTLYQPQVESWSGGVLEVREAVAVSEDKKNPHFGVIWYSAKTHVDKIERVVTLTDVQISKVSFPASPEKADSYQKILQVKAVDAPTTIALDRLQADLAAHGAHARVASVDVQNTPPKIIFSSVPALLVPVDGEPRYQKVSGTKMTRVINTKVLLLRDKSGTFYLHVFDGWLTAKSLEGPWSVAKKPPRSLSKAQKQVAKTAKVDLLEGSSGKVTPSLKKTVPVIYVETKPAALVVTQGKPDYVPLDGTQLLYATNTTGNVFVALEDNRTFVLISGRWFVASSPSGPWTYVAPSDLPADFVKIPDDSPKENVKASVPGTAQAQEAVIENSIPQTAVVEIEKLEMTPPHYDGQPKLKRIRGTSLHYVVNTNVPIIQVSPTAYYAVENGVWFYARSLGGPWAVATSVPAVIYTIPPDAPLYYVTYVTIYDVSPKYVVVGYTPGYLGAYVAGGVVVYGTGYYYTPWIGTVWFPPPVTYGYGAAVVYSPWGGWMVGFGFGWAWGVSTAYAWGVYPYWGAWGYAYGPRGAVAWGPGGWAATTGNVYHHWGNARGVTRSSAGFNAWTGNAWRTRSGTAYNSRTGRLVSGQRAAVDNVYSGNYARGARGSVTNTKTGRSVQAGRGTAGNVYTGKSASGGYVKTNKGGVARVNNNVYAQHNGNVYHRDQGGGWSQYQDGSWNNVQRSGGGSSFSRPAFENAAGARGMGNWRTNNLRASGGFDGFQPRGGGFGGGGAARLGGGFSGFGGGGFHGFGGRR